MNRQKNATISFSLSTVLIIVSVIGAVGGLLFFPSWTMDDAYIICRYVQNAYTHGALTWNSGENAVEGYTGIALPLLLFAGKTVGIDPLVGTKVIGIASFLLTGAVLYGLFRTLDFNRLTIGIALLFYYTTPFFFTHAFNGLETMLFCLGITTCFFLFARILKNGAWSSVNICCFFGCLLVTSLIRPEGVVLSAWITLVSFLCVCGKDKRIAPRMAVLFIVLYIVPGTVYFWWRWHYYGRMFPNPFYVKTTTGFVLRSHLDFRKYLLGCFAVPALAALVSCIPSPLRTWRTGASPEKTRLLFPLCIAMIGFCLVVLVEYLTCNLIMNYAHRFFIPLYPLILVLIAAILDCGITALRDATQRTPAYYASVLVLIALVAGQVAHNFQQWRAERVFAAEYKQLLKDEHIPIGTFLREHVPHNEWLVVYCDAGAIPYYAQLKTIDFGRLNDTFLTEKNISLGERIDYFYSKNPGALVLTSNNPDKIEYDFPVKGELASIIADPRFKQYSLLHIFRTKNTKWKNYCEYLYLRNDLFENLAAHIPAPEK